MSEASQNQPFLQIGSFYMPLDFISKEKLQEAFDYKATKDDIFLVTFPKCGTTWTQYIVWEILNDAALPLPSPNDMMFNIFPFLEMVGAKVASIPPPRLIKTHLPFSLNPYSPESKYIVVVRNPFDACVSFYFHLLSIQSIVKTETIFDQYFETFINGKSPFGDYFDHILSWYEHRNDSNVLFLYFEQMKTDPAKYVLQIADFLGKEHGDKLRSNSDLLQKIVENTSFKSMSKNLTFYHPSKLDHIHIRPEEEANPEKSENMVKMNFFRKGKVGDWKNHFSEDQKTRLANRLRERFQGTEMLTLYEPMIQDS